MSNHEAYERILYVSVPGKFLTCYGSILGRLSSLHLTGFVLTHIRLLSSPRFTTSSVESVALTPLISAEPTEGRVTTAYVPSATDSYYQFVFLSVGLAPYDS